MEKVIDAKYGLFEYEKDLKCIFHHWKGFLLLEEVKHVKEVTQQVMEEHGLVNVIADHREMDLFSEDISEYISAEWIPAQEKIGVKNIFVVMSEAALTKMAAEDMHDTARGKSKINIQHFSSMEDAIATVMEVNKELVKV